MTTEQQAILSICNQITQSTSLDRSDEQEYMCPKCGEEANAAFSKCGCGLEPVERESEE